MSTEPTLAARLAGPSIVVAPGVYDALGAVIAEQAGFDTAYLSGASIAYCRFGRPDIGLVGLAEVAQTLSDINERSALDLVVDADTGYGNALNVQRTVRLLERNGAAAVQIEDQASPKRCGHLAGKTLILTSEMVGKVKAAVDARASESTLIVARTDAIAVEGLEPALERDERYVEAGADVLFVEAPREEVGILAVVARLAARAPLLANMVEGGRTPLRTADQLEALGYRLVIFPGGLVRAVAHTAREYFASLRAHGTNAPLAHRMLDLDGVNALLGTEQMLERGRAYDAARFADGDG
jgi:2-methylisocitrate lyase-like PEP mutase family enzyme